jgi:hypothetical protein
MAPVWSIRLSRGFLYIVNYLGSIIRSFPIFKNSKNSKLSTGKIVDKLLLETLKIDYPQITQKR